MAATNKILVLFKTHLDLGFTDLAETVRRKYMQSGPPDAHAQEGRPVPVYHFI